MENTIWSRRSNAVATNNGKLSLATNGSYLNGTPSGSHADASGGRGPQTAPVRRPTDSAGSQARSAVSFSSSNAGGVASPGGGGGGGNSSAASAFGLGSGAFAAFGSAKTPKTPGNPFDAAMGQFGMGAAAPPSAKTPGLDRAARDAFLGAGAGASAGAPGESRRGGTVAATAVSDDGSSGAAGAHRLRYSYRFWYRPPLAKSAGYVDYEKTIHPMATVDTLEEFCCVYRHLRRPSSLPLVSDYHLFKKDIRPIWEDLENRKGGKWIVRLRKGVADRYWEDILVALVGDQFAEAGGDVCGVVLSVRNGEDILSIWTKTDGGRNIKIRETMKRVLQFPPDTKIEWKSHDSSIQHRTAVEESRREKAANNHHNNNNNQGDKGQQGRQGEDRRINDSSFGGGGAN